MLGAKPNEGLEGELWRTQLSVVWMLTHLAVAWLTIWAVSCISTMKLLELLSMLSEVPMRVKSLSTSLTDANLAGTKLPICAMITMRATCMVSLLEVGNQLCISVCQRNVRGTCMYVSAMLGVGRWARLGWTGLRLGGGLGGMMGLRVVRWGGHGMANCVGASKWSLRANERDENALGQSRAEEI